MKNKQQLKEEFLTKSFEWFQANLPISPELLNILRSCRWRLSEVLDKCWELGGQYVGEEEFESYSWVQEARKQIEEIDKILNQ